jgi:hypothetical protein
MVSSYFGDSWLGELLQVLQFWLLILLSHTSNTAIDGTEACLQLDAVQSSNVDEGMQAAARWHTSIRQSILTPTHRLRASNRARGLALPLACYTHPSVFEKKNGAGNQVTAMRVAVV